MSHYILLQLISYISPLLSSLRAGTIFCMNVLLFLLARCLAYGRSWKIFVELINEAVSGLPSHRACGDSPDFQNLIQGGSFVLFLLPPSFLLLAPSLFIAFPFQPSFLTYSHLEMRGSQTTLLFEVCVLQANLLEDNYSDQIVGACAMNTIH